MSLPKLFEELVVKPVAAMGYLGQELEQTICKLYPAR